MRVSVAREVVGFVIRYQHFTLPQMKINDKIFFSYHTRNHFDFQNRMLWIHLFFFNVENRENVKYFKQVQGPWYTWTSYPAPNHNTQARAFEEFPSFPCN